MKLLLLLVFLVAGICASGQLNFDYTEGKVLLKGTVIDLQTQKPIPLANVVISRSGRGVTCDNEGKFTLYVYPTDTLKFSSVSYLNKLIHVHDIDSNKRYTLEVQLYRDAIKIKEVDIYPYRDLDAFKKAFVDAKEVYKVHIPGIPEPKYSNIPTHAKFSNPISLLYEKLKHHSSANPDFRP